MTVTVLLFARARELAGRGEVDLQIARDSSVADVRAALVEKIPELGEIIAHCAFAVDQQYAGDDDRIHDNSEIGCIPPVSGG